ncbi:Stk1 family PASTA domain-containing Ser/Thr kinase [Streptomyces sp. NPDC060194]|uniref:Stk1 family PASTA domain-containing Ser/Thr kinase n=1 Tax=Streptomyces sp. NPDC060194 TaxID=3347069 RepID=UPI003650EC61
MDTTLIDPLAGQLLDGRYRIDARIAVGGMATVYRAVDTRLDRLVALKVMHPALAADQSFVERFIREAKSVARLDHPNVVGVFDQGNDRGYVYLAMEYVAGCTLRDVLRERGALQPRAALDILEPVLAALGAAHLAGFVHRDMKPENVLIGDDGRVKVADFGLVRSVDAATGTTGEVLGTVSYLAPEQIEQGITDARADVYACGVVLYEMLTGAKPHTGDTPAQILYRHLNEDVPNPSRLVPELAYELDDLVTLATARNPQVRPYDAVAFLAEVRTAHAALSDEQLDSAPPQARTPEPAGPVGPEERTSVLAMSEPDTRRHRTSRLHMPAGPPPSAPPTVGVRGGGTGRRRPPRRGLLGLGAALLLIGLVTGFWYINSGQFTRVPALVGKTEAQARSELAEAGLRAGSVERAFSDTDEAGRVMSSDPGIGERIRDDDAVELTISKGPERIGVPRLAGVPLDEAKRRLEDAGLAPGAVAREFSEDVGKGEVVRTDPAAGTEVRSGKAIAITVSKGAPVDVPDVAGRSVDDATRALEEQGLKVELAPERVHSEHDEGEVARQSPAGGEEAVRGDTVTLTVSKGPVQVTVPDVTGLSVDEATTELRGAGFEVEEDRGLLGLFGDTVESQSVPGGQRAPEGGTIRITIR